MERPRGLNVIIGLLFFATAATILYWIAFFFIPGSVQASDDPCYIVFELSFPLADGWMALAAFLGGIGLIKRRDWGLLFAFMAAGAAIFLGLMDVLYNLEHGMYTRLSGEMLIEIAINVLLLSLGPVIAAYLWKHRKSLGF